MSKKLIQMAQLTELANKSLMKALSFFLRNPTSRNSYTNLREKIKIAKATLTKHLDFLLKENFIQVEKIGLNKIYRLNRDNQVVRQFKILDNLLSLNEIKALVEKCNVEIYLYGSSSRGEDTENSDIDLLIIGKINKEKLMPYLSSISKQIKREIKLAVFSPLEWSQLSRKDNAFYERVEKDKIRLC